MSDKQGWTSGPNGRGSFDILWNCLSTLALCVWSAIHPDILLVPSFSRAFLSRVGMMLIAIVFPEIIISAAWKQLRESRWLCAEVNALYQDPSAKLQLQSVKAKHSTQADDRESQHRMLPTFEFDTTSGILITRHSSTGVIEERTQFSPSKKNDKSKGPIQWSSKQAFFAVMGGFAIENDYDDRANDTKVSLRRFVTVEGILQLAKLGMLPKISKDDIEERSKADIIAKIFVLSQITWFGLQVIGRLTSRIPVTPLEVHTVIHVACTIAIYVMWIKKPYDVRSSMLLSDPDVKDMGALFNFFKVAIEIHARAYAKYEHTRASYWKDRVVRAASNLLDHDPPPTPPAREALTTAVERYSLLNTQPDSAIPPSNNTQEQILVALAPAAQRSLERLRKDAGASDELLNAQSWDLLRDKSGNFTIREVWGGWSTDSGHEMSLEKGVHFLFNFLYGGCHLAAWASSSFPTPLEQWLWRGSAIMLTLVPLWGSLWILWWKAARSKRKVLYFVRNGDLDILVAPFFFVVILIYVFARSYLLVESLISLRLLPAGAFLSVSWTRFIPHIS